MVVVDGRDVGEPRWGYVDPVSATITLTARGDRALGSYDWQRIIAHMLLHLGLNHGARRGDRDPLLWNLVCEASCTELLTLFGFNALPGREQSGSTEGAAYDMLVLELESGDRSRVTAFETPAGKGRPDLIGLSREIAFNRRHEELLGQAIRRAVSVAVRDAVSEASDSSYGSGSFAQLESAKRWVYQHIPLLGAVSAQVRVVVDPKVCDIRDIPVAAVNPYLGEIYLNTAVNLTHEEWRFVYVHELMHLALLHHSRIRGRDPLIWNFACDFVINDWLLQMNVGPIPKIGMLWDPRIRGMSSDEVYELLMKSPSERKKLRGFRGKLGDILLDTGSRRVFRGDVTTLDDILRRCVEMALPGILPGSLPGGLLEDIRSLFVPAVPWDVELARWMESHVPYVRDPIRTYARLSRRQSSTPEIPRPARWIPREMKDACTFGVVLDSSGSMDHETLGEAFGAIASFAESRAVERVRVVQCDVEPFDMGWLSTEDLRGILPVRGRGGTALQPGINLLLSRSDLPAAAPVMVLTDGYCEAELLVAREHCFVLPRKRWKEGGVLLRTSAPVFRVLS